MTPNGNGTLHVLTCVCGLFVKRIARMNRLTKTEPISLKKVKGRVSLSPLSFVGASLGFGAVFLEVGIFGTPRNGHVNFFIANQRMKNRNRNGSFS